ncbi:transcriptional regulator [Citromicrobium bathyomarinum]|jgi:DNA-binding transcriptional ArsR family regulator|uniref:winged helix-turn-helix domain-containing protein n=1 Tax=Sphingomonadales TaxID=204457 RepID=UPI000C4E5BB7|nr:transcriptional regulator [Citromicrobium sp.]MBO82104.1 transcriptional regulator [Citromicrobium sp.]|tara:strand:- start:968 stop:1285 length:318 start_codon:yes stop_codon:yes gene_type:complete
MADLPLDYRAIDDTIHGRVRLATMAYLSSAECADFGELRARTGVSDGNLSVHLRKLEDAGYVAIEKRFEGKKPVTTACLTEVGREAWIAYLDRMKAMLFGADPPA